MKTKTIDKILKKLNIIVEVIKSNKDKLDAYEEISRIEDLLNKEKVRKEEKKKILDSKWVTFKYCADKCGVREVNSVDYQKGFEDAKRQDRFPIGIYWKYMYGFEITPTNKIVINNGKHFKLLLDILNEAYKDQCVISKKYCTDGITVKDLKEVINSCSDDYLVCITSKEGLSSRISKVESIKATEMPSDNKINILSLSSTMD